MKTKQLVKEIASVVKGGKKVWMAFETEPHVDVVGGLAGGENFDLDKMAIVMDKVEKYVAKCGYASRKEIYVYIK